MEVSNVIQFTDTVIGNIDPVFEHRMSFLVNDPRSDIIKIHIMVRHIKDRGPCAHNDLKPGRGNSIFAGQYTVFKKI